MIVPRTRLLAWFALVVVPFGTTAGVVPGATAVCVAVIALFVVLLVIDGFLALDSLKGVSLGLSPLIRATQERSFTVPIRIHNPSQRARTIRIALEWPEALTPAVEEFTIGLPGGTEWSAFDWNCSSLQRGKFALSAARIEAASPLGFWARWRDVPVNCELRIYPNLARERHSLAALFLRRGAFGVHAQRQIGRGRDFEKLREYIPGDSFEDVHWKATAKRSHPVTKVYQIERTQEIYVIIDASRLSARTLSREKNLESGKALLPSTTLERFITAALVLGLAAEQQGDLFGLLTFSDKVETFLRARNGKSHYHNCRDALYTLQARQVAPDFDELSTFIRLRLRRRALLLFLTSLDDPVVAESFVRNMDLLSRQHVVVVNMLQPAGVRPVFSNDRPAALNDLYPELAGHLRWQQLRELEKVLQRRGVRLSLLPSERLAADLVSQYLSVKQRQML